MASDAAGHVQYAQRPRSPGSEAQSRGIVSRTGAGPHRRMLASRPAAWPDGSAHSGGSPRTQRPAASRQWSTRSSSCPPHACAACAGGARAACPTCSGGRQPILNNRYATRAERLYGYRSDSLVYQVYRINQRGDFDVRLDRARKLPVVGWLVPYGAFLWAGVRYDHFGFFFDGGLLGGPGLALELPLLRLAGKGIVVYPYGGDARVASATRERGPWHAYSDIPVGRRG